jgi:SAM-dependent methyltransferase
MFLLNVLHHLPDAGAFFLELERTLAPGGRVVLIEPYVSPVSRLVYRFGHHEPFDPAQRDWTLPPGGAMTSANDALPWIVLCRDRRRFDASFPGLEVRELRAHTIALYVLSGGFSYRSLLPAWLFPVVAAAEDLACAVPGSRFLASMMTVVIVKRPGHGVPG